MQHLSVMSPEN